MLGNMGFSSDVNAAVLGHADIAQGATAVYARSRYEAQHREALQKWADKLDTIVAPAATAQIAAAA